MCFRLFPWVLKNIFKLLTISNAHKASNLSDHQLWRCRFNPHKNAEKKTCLLNSIPVLRPPGQNFYLTFISVVTLISFFAPERRQQCSCQHQPVRNLGHQLWDLFRATTANESLVEAVVCSNQAEKCLSLERGHSGVKCCPGNMRR